MVNFERHQIEALAEVLKDVKQNQGWAVQAFVPLGMLRVRVLKFSSISS